MRGKLKNPDEGKPPLGMYTPKKIMEIYMGMDSYEELCELVRKHDSQEISRKKFLATMKNRYQIEPREGFAYKAIGIKSLMLPV